ncbi:MAG TPA: hypothetical protein VFV87_05740, partial [Pirellulaceae bacterium]|nr:hypothetical protein [Pirellulaceae bacterium]
AMVEFLARNGPRSETELWIEKLESLAPAPPKNDGDLMARIVELRIKLNTLDQCTNWLDRLEAAEPGRIRPFILRAKLLVAQGQPQEAIANLDAKADELLLAAKEQKEQVEIVKAVGDFYFSSDLATSAETWYGRLAKLDPEQAPLAILALAREQRMTEAIRLCIARSQNDETARYAIVAAAVLAESPAESDASALADPLFASALKRFPGNINLLYSLGTLRVAQGRYGEAVNLFRETITKSPRHVPALNNLALILSESPATRAEALQLIDRAIAVVGENPSLLDTKGAILIYGGQASAALPLLQTAARGSAVDPRHQLHLAAAYQGTAQSQLARDMLKLALDQKIEKLILTQTDKNLLADLRGRLGL